MRVAEQMSRTQAERIKAIMRTTETTVVLVENDLKQEDSDSSKVAPRHEEQEPVKSEVLKVQRSTHGKRLSIWSSEYVIESNIAYCLLTKDEEPSIFHEAITMPDVSLWMTVIQEEIKALQNKTWELAPLPHGRKAIGNN
ncbi:hypothetical protein Q3G72_012537 [Acer saccharum]|nr:hypothetical protein Q3G72_012537 [Acer saccharum]